MLLDKMVVRCLRKGVFSGIFAGSHLEILEKFGLIMTNVAGARGCGT
ncbi:hypothetical protein THTE_2581 [Thermogutta terrifontis]|uniref:Uncharacterized protein n=1 Tax=Thermogutta terrifontis TaxID=1331910 RepID=A0A286RGV4_9BACT|nr:hypothetical protein THTE_2581 [Thermogutta terrifontis]